MLNPNSLIKLVFCGGEQVFVFIQLEIRAVRPGGGLAWIVWENNFQVNQLKTCFLHFESSTYAFIITGKNLSKWRHTYSVSYVKSSKDSYSNIDNFILRGRGVRKIIDEASHLKLQVQVRDGSPKMQAGHCAQLQYWPHCCLQSRQVIRLKKRLGHNAIQLLYCTSTVQSSKYSTEYRKTYSRSWWIHG